MAYTKTTWTEGVTPLDKTNMDHLETQYDEAVKGSQTVPGRTHDVIYQNTTAKLRFVTFSMIMTDATTYIANAYCDAAATPITSVAGMRYAATDPTELSFHFCVPPSYYYRIVLSTTGAHGISWVEWELG